jgi:hypothetical protein
MNDATKQIAGRRTLGLRFSLSSLLLGLTAFAIGFPVWYSWPYTEQELVYPEVNGEPDKTKPPMLRVVTSWRRNWGGKPYKHGESRVYRAGGGIIASTEYRRDKRNGPKKSFRDDGSLQWIEEYEDDERVGMTTYQASGKILYRAEMAGIWLNGNLEQHLADGTVVTWQFDHGRVVSRDGESLTCGLFDALALGEVEQTLRLNLQLLISPVYGATPQEELELFADELGIALQIDHPENMRWDERPFVPFMGIDTASVLMLQAHALGRECEYRDGKVWITSSAEKDP